eukprot:957211_1
MSTAEPTSGDSRDDRKIDFSILLKTKKNNPKFLREILQSNLEDYVIAKSPTRPQPGTVLVYRQEKVGDTDFSVNEEQSRPIYASTESASTGDMKEPAVLNVNTTVKPDSDMKPSVKPGVKSKKRDQSLSENPGPSRRSKRRRTTVDREMFVAH